MVILTGRLMSYYKFDSIAFKVSIVCEVGLLKSPQSDMELTYVPEFTQL